MTEKSLLRLSRSAGRSCLAAVAVTFAVVLAACSSSGAAAGPSGTATSAHASRGASGSTSSSSGSPCVDAATTAVAPYEGLPTKLPANLTPLTAKPHTGTIIKLVNGKISGDIDAGKALIQAAQAAGWTGKVITYNGTVEDLNAKWMQAVGEKPTAIVASGFPAASIQTALAASKAAGIITLLFGTNDTPGQGNDLSAVAEGAEAFKTQGVLNAQLMLKDSGCDAAAHALIATAPFDSLKSTADGFTSTAKQLLPGISIQTATIQVTDLGTPAATGAVVSAIQADPKIRYVFATIGSVVDGLPAALSAAGISGVKIFGAVPDIQSIQGLRDRSEAWWTTQDASIGSWVQMDTVLRVADAGGVGKAKPISESGDPLGVITPDNVDKKSKTVPVYPADYEKQFKTLWHTA